MTRQQIRLLFKLAHKMTIIQQRYFAIFLEDEAELRGDWSKVTNVAIERLAEQALTN